MNINPLNAELNPICHLPALLGAHHILHISRIRVNVTLAMWFAIYRSTFAGTHLLYLQNSGYVCVCTRARACVRASVGESVRVCVCEREREREHARAHALARSMVLKWVKEV
jgi:hypothetical protein